MKNIIFLALFLSFPALASVVGISTHPLSKQARVLTAEMTGYMSQRHEMGMGLRYTQEVNQTQLMDFSASGAQDSRALTIGMGMDFEMLSEEISQPRVSLKPFYQYQKFEAEKMYVLGVAPTMRKGFSVEGVEFFPYVAVPSGIRIDSTSDEFVYHASLTLGASMPLPGANAEKLVFSLEANKEMGSSSDYVGALVSWLWR